MLVFLTMQRYGKDRMPPKTFNERPVFLGKPFLRQHSRHRPTGNGMVP